MPEELTTRLPVSQPGAMRAVSAVALSSEEVRRLTLYKWRYSLESSGFTPREAARLLFMKWLYSHTGVRD